MKLGLIIPTNWGHEDPPTSKLLQFCRRADELGFDSLWVIDRLFHDQGVPHPFVMLSYAAAVTTRIGLGTGVALLNVRHPIEVAQEAATLNSLAGERLTLGVSLGGRDTEYEAAGVPFEQRVGRLVEGMRVMRRLWRETNVTHEGRYYRLTNASIVPQPKQPRGIPLLIGAATPPALERAGRIADGWIQGGRGTPESFKQAWQTVKDAATAAGRDASKLTSAKLYYANPVADEEEAQREMQDYLSLYYGPGYPLEFTACGSTASIVERVQAFGDAGCDLIILGLPGPDLEKLELLAREVLPRVTR